MVDAGEEGGVEGMEEVGREGTSEVEAKGLYGLYLVCTLLG
jgi:hypothetical protein